MKNYPKYKPSGVEWIGEIPDNWNDYKIKFSINVNKKTLNESTAQDFEFNYIDIESVNGSTIEKTQKLTFANAPSRARRLLQKGDVIVSTVRTYLKAIAQVPDIEGNIVASTGFAIFSPSKILLSDYLKYLAVNDYFIQSVVSRSKGANYPAIAPSELVTIKTPIPLINEQQKIVNFLDYKTGQCDRFIGNRQKQIELLNEQKASIINKAVTKGINPNAKMKPSDIEWIGDIPEHWECMKIKRLSVVKRGASPRPIDDPKYFDENGEFAWVRIADVTASERYLENTTQRLSKLGSSLSVKMYPNDFFLSIAGSVGKPIITKIKCCIHDGFVWFPYLKINHEFLYYLFSTGLPYQGLGKFGTQLNLNTDTVGDIFLPIPTADEMTIIVSFIDNQTQKIDCLISKYQKQIELMQEYRIALISQAVTGKIDVRDWKPQTK
jgi:type I restriction enzyme S subunit